MIGHLGHHDPRRRLLATLALVAASSSLLAATATSAAAATIGQTTPTANYACQAEFDLQTGVASGTTFVVPPGSWLLTAWSTFAGATGGSMSLMIFRPTANPFSYTVLAESPLQALTPNMVNSFPANVIVRGGDLLGFWSGNGAACATFTGMPADVNPFGFGPEPTVGSTVTTSIALGFLLNISATIKGPADLLNDLRVDVTDQGPGKSLAAKVMEIQNDLGMNDQAAGCATLSDFISEVNAQTGKTLTSAQASSFTTQAEQIKTLLEC